jgi:hypothetical protein
MIGVRPLGRIVGNGSVADVAGGRVLGFCTAMSLSEIIKLRLLTAGTVMADSTAAYCLDPTGEILVLESLIIVRCQIRRDHRVGTPVTGDAIDSTMTLRIPV